MGGTLPPVVLSTCAGWPICTGPVTTTTTETPISCATIVSESESGYSSKISVASSSMAASGTNYPPGLTIANAATTGSVPSSAASVTATTTPATTSAGTAAGASSSGNGGTNLGSGAVVSNVFLPVVVALGAGLLGVAAYL